MFYLYHSFTKGFISGLKVAFIYWCIGHYVVLITKLKTIKTVIGDRFVKREILRICHMTLVFFFFLK